MSVKTNDEIMFISIVVPVFQAEQTIFPLVEQIVNVCTQTGCKFELILVEDGSRDSSWEIISNLANANPSIKAVKLSRNFGQHPAIFAGLQLSNGDAVVVMDCDLQDSPSEIPKLIDSLNKYDVALAQREKRKDSFSRVLSSAVFYRFLSYMSGMKQDSSVANFGAYKRKVIEAVLSSQESNKYFPLAVQWTGFDTVKVPVVHSKREFGKSNYTFNKLMKLALDITLSFSEKPLKMTLILGLFLTLTGVCLAIYNVALTLISGVVAPGFTTVIVSIWAFSGINTLVLSIIGIYLGRVYNEVKQRPVFIVSECIN